MSSTSRIPLNKNLQAINQIQNGMLEANAMRRSVSKNRLLQHIKQACNAKQFIFGRQMLGHQIYNAGKTNFNQYIFFARLKFIRLLRLRISEIKNDARLKHHYDVELLCTRDV